MKKQLKWVFCRHPRTTAEKRANQEGWERPRRRPHLLPDNYDDVFVHSEKGWKAKRKTQYHPGGRGQEHSITVNADFTYEWYLTEYFNEHNIPYRLEKINEEHTFKQTLWKRVKNEYKSAIRRCVRVKDENGKWKWDYKIIGWEYKSHWEKDGWKWATGSRVVAYKLIWWCDKDVGIEYILRRCRRRRLHSYI